MKITFGWIWFLPLLCAAAVIPNCAAQSRLGLRDAVAEALRSRASLAALAQEVSAAQGAERQARLIENPTFQFENQNLRPGMTYGTDVDTYAFLTQPLDILGKRKRRIQVAQGEVASAQADYELERRRIARGVAQAYWAARGAQENRDLLGATVENFQKIVDYESAQLRVGAISEQDFLRIRLEDERLKVAQNLAAIEATRTRVELERALGRTAFAELVLSEPLDGNQARGAAASVEQVLAQRVEMRVAGAALASAEAKEKLEEAAARPELSLEAGYKRTELVDTNNGTNTALAGLQITLPVSDRNQGNRAAAGAEVRRQRQLLAETQANVLADYYGAVQEYELRSREVSQALVPLRDDAAQIAQIAENVYAQTGLDLLRLIDAERAQIDAQVAYVQGMVAYQQSIANLEAAEGVAP